jgi:hypothetical protein
LERLEPGAGKLARPVLRGGWLGNELSLPDKAVFDGNPLGGKLNGFLHFWTMT